MSLDFYLEGKEIEEECCCNCCDNIHLRKYSPELFRMNLTRNLANMANEAGLYKCLWRPDENGFVYAKDLKETLRKGLDFLTDDHERFKKMNPSNGWGSYENLRHFVYQLFIACVEYPESKIRVQR